MKPPRSTLTAVDKRVIREINRAELLPVYKELRLLRKALDKICQDKKCQQ